MLPAEVSTGNLKKLIGFVGDRLGNKSIDFKVQAKGKKLKLKALAS
ncbi:hypothetical protein [Scytonema hofmannii]|nr:hypothetical protein [Scytonema hofmannii]